MPFKLYLGSNINEVATLAKFDDPTATLLTQTTIKQLDNLLTVYTNLDFLTEKQILELIRNTDYIVYWPSLTKPGNLLALLSTVDKYIINYTPDSLLGLADTRKTNSNQLWIAGCSYAHGLSLPNINLRYGQLVADNLQLPVSFLTCPGSSIEWAADQILRSEIQGGDVVILGVTGLNRLMYFHNNEIHHVLSTLTDTNESMFSRGSALHKYLSMQLVDDNRISSGVKSIFQVSNFCKRVGARLVVLGHLDMTIIEHGNKFSSYLMHLPNYIDAVEHLDLGLDSIHPGPLTHQTWAKEILSCL